MNIEKPIKNNPIVNYVVIIQLITIFSIYLNIPLIRQISSFISITFIPGYLIFRKIGIKFSDFFELFLFSTGLSIFYLMFMGLIINLVYPIIGLIPLSSVSILVTFIILNFILIIINLQEKENDLLQSYEFITFINNNKAISIFTLLVFIFNVLLNIVVYFISSNLIYVSLLFNIVFLYFFIIYSYHEKYKNIYYLLIFIISLSLVMQTVLSSKYIIGSDISIEFFVFKITKNNALWDPFYFDPNVWTGIITYNSMLSVTVLPTIYSSFFNISDDFVFKIIYPFIMSLIPLILVKIYNNYIKNYAFYSFISILFYLSDDTVFYGVIPLSLCKQIAAVFFMLLFFLLLVKDDIRILYKQILLIIFGYSVFISHYSTSYIFLFLIFFIFLINKLLFKDDIGLTLNIVLLLLSLKIIWDAFVTIKTINYIYYMINGVYNRFISDLFNPAARNAELYVLTRESGSIIHKIHRIIFYIVHIFLSMGIFSIFINRKKQKVNNIYQTISLLCYFIIVTVVLVPVISSWFGITRFRGMTMLFLTPFIVIGYDLFIYMLQNIGEIKAFFSFPNIRLENYDFNILSHKKRHLHIITIMLVTYFLFNVGYVNYAFNDKPLSYIFDSDRMSTSMDPEIVVSYYAQYKPEWDVYSTLWLMNNSNPDSNIHSDYVSAWHVLISHGLMDNVRVNQFRNNTLLYEGNYIYLSYMNLDKNITSTFRPGLANNRVLYNSTILSEILIINNKIYSNGYSEIYRCISDDQNRVILIDEE